MFCQSNEESLKIRISGFLFVMQAKLDFITQESSTYTHKNYLRLKCIEHYNSTTKNKPDYICKIAPSQEINHDTIVTNKKILVCVHNWKNVQTKTKLIPKPGLSYFLKKKKVARSINVFSLLHQPNTSFFSWKSSKKNHTIKSLTLKNPCKFFKNLSSLVSIKNYRSNSNSLSLTFHLVNFSLVLICFSEISCFTHKNVQMRIVLEWIFKRLNDACNDESIIPTLKFERLMGMCCNFVFKNRNT